MLVTMKPTRGTSSRCHSTLAITRRGSDPPASQAARHHTRASAHAASLERHTLPSALRETSISPMWQRDTKTVSLLVRPYSACHSPHPRQWKIYRSGSPPNRCVLRANFIGWAQPRQRGGLGAFGVKPVSAFVTHDTVLAYASETRPPLILGGSITHEWLEA